MDHPRRQRPHAPRVLFLMALTLLLLASLAAPPLRGAEEKIDAPAKKLMAASGLFDRGLFDMAEQEYADFLKTYPNHPEALTARYGQAICQYKQNHFAQTAAALTEILKAKNFAQRQEALAVLGHCCLATSAYDKALAAFDQLLKEFPASDHAEPAALDRIQALYMLNRKAEALEASKAFLQRYPKSERVAAATYFLGVSQIDTGKQDEAIETLKDLVKRFPDSPQWLDAVLLLGQAYETKGDTASANAQYQRLITNAAGGRKAEGYYAMGVAFYKARNYPEAAKRLEMVLKEFSASDYAAPARLQLGLTQLAQGNLAAARKTLAAVAESDKTRAATARYWLAQADMTEKKFDAAYLALDALAQQSPAVENLEAVLFDRACCLMAQEKFDAAAGQFAALRAKFPAGKQAADALYRQAFSLHKLEQYDKSFSLCQELAKAPSSAVSGPARELAAENLFLLQKYDQATPLFEDLVGSAEGNAKARFTFRLAQCAYFRKDYAKAAGLLAQVVASPDAGDALLRDAAFLQGDAELQQGRYAAAQQALSRYLATTAGAGSLEAQYKLAVAQIRGNNPADAAATLAKLTRGPADSPWVLRGLFESGQLDYQAKRYDAAAAALKKVLAGKAGDDLKAPAAYLLAWIEFDNHRFAQADKAFAEVSAKYPGHALAQAAAYQRALAVKEAGKPADALPLLAAYLEKFPAGENAANARYLIGVCQSQLGRREEAIKTFSAIAADKAARNDTVLYELAWAFRAANDNGRAVETYRALLKDFPASTRAPAVHTELADLLYGSGQYGEAAALLEHVTALEGVDANTWAVAQHRLGWCDAKLGKHDAAAKVFALFVARMPDHELAPAALYQAGVAQVEARQTTEAEKTFASLRERYPKSDLASAGLLKLGELAALREDFSRSKELYERYLAEHGKEKFVYLAQFGLGWACENLKDFDAARQWYGKVIAAHNGPTAARAQFQMGETYFTQGDFARAAKELLTVDIVYAYPEWSAPALYEAGRAFEQLKQLADAKTQYRQCAAKYKDTPEARLAAKRLKALER